MSVIVNGTNLQTLGFELLRRRTPRVLGERSTATAIPSAYGGVRVGGTTEPGTVAVEGSIVVATPAALQAAISALARAVRGGCSIAFADRLDREWHGHLQPGSADELHPQLATTVAEVKLEWLCPDPLSAARAETVLPLATGASVALVLGDAPSPLRVELRNVGAANITQITVRVWRGGTQLSAFVWAGQLAPGKVWVVDDESHAVTADGAYAGDGYADGSTFPYADPAEGADRVTVESVGAAGAAAVRYHQRWEG